MVSCQVFNGVLVLLIVVLVCPQSTAFIMPRAGGWIGWWSLELPVTLALKLLLFWESMVSGDVSSSV